MYIRNFRCTYEIIKLQMYMRNSYVHFRCTYETKYETSDVATCENRMYVSDVHAKFVYTSVYIRNSYVATFSYVPTYETQMYIRNFNCTYTKLI